MGFIDKDHFDDEQCLMLLGRAQFGRIATTLKAVSIVFPVRYGISGGNLLFTLPDEQLASAVDGKVASLQADGFEEDQGQRWTVLAAGPVSRAEGFDRPASFVPPEAAPAEPPHLFLLQPVILSGRWIEAF